LGRNLTDSAKAGVRTLTEQLAHGLREAHAPVTAHLLVPGWTFTGMTNAPDGHQPAGTWTAAQVHILVENERGIRFQNEQRFWRKMSSDFDRKMSS
jgi:NAD(P)-dependent dehydrogenase (short-subunit alcohol dehydrogenase family)